MTPYPDHFRHLYSRLLATPRPLQSWSACTIDNVTLHLKVARKVITCFGAVQDLRLLSAFEIWLSRKHKVVYLGLARLDRSITFLHFFWLMNGKITSRLPSFACLAQDAKEPHILSQGGGYFRLETG